MKKFNLIINDKNTDARREDLHISLINKIKSYNPPPPQLLTFIHKKENSIQPQSFPRTFVDTAAATNEAKIIVPRKKIKKFNMFSFPIKNEIETITQVKNTPAPPTPPAAFQSELNYRSEFNYTIKEIVEKTLYVPDQVPKNIFQTWHTKELPPKMREAVDGLKNENPDFAHFLFDVDDCRNFIAEYFDEEVLRAYDSLIPIAYKSDLWRYCVLYIYGGIYIDVKFEQICSGQTLNELITDEHFVIDYGSNINNINALYNGFIICKPNNQIMYNAIREIVNNIKRDDYKCNALEPTGPKLLGNIIKSSIIYEKYIKNVDMILHVTQDDILYIKQGTDPNTENAYYKIYDEYRNEKNSNKDHYYYPVAWANRNIYSTNDLSIKNNVIPMHVYQTWITKDLPHYMKMCNDLLREQNPEFEFHLYDDTNCREFIRNNYDEDVLRAYDKLVPGAYKADLWRYCVLYKNGGIYLDCKYFCMNNFKLTHFLQDEYFIKDVFVVDIFNAVMICKPKNPILWNCIQNIVKYTRDEFYGEASLSVTGPGMMRYIFDKYKNEYNRIELLHKTTTKINNVQLHGLIYSEKYKKIILATYPHYRIEQINFSKKEHYGELWVKKQIYDRSVPSPRGDGAALFL